MQRDQAPQDVRKAWQTQSVMTPFVATLAEGKVRRSSLIHSGFDLYGILNLAVIGLFFAAAAIAGEMALCRAGAALFSLGAFHFGYRLLVARSRPVTSNAWGQQQYGFLPD